MSQRPAVDIERIGVGKFALVAIAGAEGERDLVAGMDRLAVQLDIARGNALETLRRGVEAKRFLDRRRDQGRIGNEAPPRVRRVVKVERTCS